MEPLFVVDTGGFKTTPRKHVKNYFVENGSAPTVISLTDGIDFGNSSRVQNNKKELALENNFVSNLHTSRNILRSSNLVGLHETGKLSSIDEIMKKSVLTPGLEKCDAVPMAETSKRKLSKLQKLERERTKGSMWFNMPAPEMTEEMKHDLEVLQMRSVLDPKHFYKKNDLKVLPKYFQVGRVIEAPADFYHSRVPKKMRKKTIVEELLADAEFQKYNKKRYKEIIEERRKTHFKAHKQAKKLKKKKRKH